MSYSKPSILILFLSWVAMQYYSCKSVEPVLASSENTIQSLNHNGGSSGMEQLGDNFYLVVYDVKSFKAGSRMAMIRVGEEKLEVLGIPISDWGEEGRASDLESICKISGTTNEYLIAESGNWQGELGRIFHIQVDTTTFSAKVLGITKLPYRDINNLERVGDQYEAMACLPYSETERILILAERGGSKVNPHGVVRWGIYDLSNHQLQFTEAGRQGISVKAPGSWTNEKSKRDITDFHIDSEGKIWATASEDISDAGPFHSVMYQLGLVDYADKERPFTIFSEFDTWISIPGFKIEALSGPSKNIRCTHSFGTEDEMYGGVWRPITIK